MIELFEDYIRNNWHNFNFPFKLPEKFSYFFLKGFRKAIFYIFKDNDSEPFAILKVSNDPIAFDRLRREYETLSFLSTKDCMKGKIPQPLALFELKGHKCIFESTLEGVPLVYLIKGTKSKRGLKRMKDIFKMVVDALITLHNINIKMEVDTRTQNSFKSSFTHSVIEHGDFNPSNLFISIISNGSIRIFDWEYSVMGGIPLKDLLDFSLWYILFTRYLSRENTREQPVLKDFEETFLSKNIHTKIIWDNIKVYVDKIGIEKSVTYDILVNFAAKYLNKEDTQLFCENLKSFF